MLLDSLPEHLVVLFGKENLHLVEVDCAGAVHVHLVEELLLHLDALVFGELHFVLLLVLLDEVVEQGLRLLNVQLAVAVQVDGLEEGHHGFLELVDLLLEVALLRLCDLVHEVVELERLFVVNAHNLVGIGLQHGGDASQRSANLNVEGELGTLELLVAVYKFPNLEFVLVESRRDHETHFGVRVSPLSANGVAWCVQLLNARDASLAVGVHVHVLDDLLLGN